jgi:methionyl-tRNA formyltransferase
VRVLFFGTPGCAVPYLGAIERAGGDIVGVVTQPDRPRGRGRQLCAPPVKEAAGSLECCLIQPDSCRDEDFLSQLRDLSPDIVLVVAFGEILCPELLAVPRVAALNVHYSLLPAYRGAAPVQHALLDGLPETGVTLQYLARELDAGDIVAQATLPILIQDTTETLTMRLTDLGCELVVAQLPLLMAGTAARTAQDHARATLAPRLTKADGFLRWGESARALLNRIRAVTPWPGALCRVRGKRLQIREARVAEAGDCSGRPGEILGLPDLSGYVVACGQGCLELLTVQPEGKKAMSAAEYQRGARLPVGELLGEESGR